MKHFLRATMLATALLIPGLLCADPAPGAGFIYGTVTLREGGTHTGFLRWKDEEAFWDDLFQSRQRESPWLEHVDQEELNRERQRRFYETHGLFRRLAWSLHGREEQESPRHLFICRFGDLAALRVSRDEDESVIAVMRDGRELPIGGYSNDVDTDILVYAAPGEPVELEWRDIAEIHFGAAPATAVPYTKRLTGTVEHREGKLAGFIQWDQSECTSDDMLDSDQEDVPVGLVRRIARNRRGGSRVELMDDRVLELDGSNDVGRGNRGIMVEVDGIGRVTVPWNRFLAADLHTGPALAPDYAAFAAPVPLMGSVIDIDGRKISGRLVYDLDEAFTADILNGSFEGCDYNIPFGLVAVIEPRDANNCAVTLRQGTVLDLSGDEDTGDGHAGVLVFEAGHEEPAHVAWARIRRLEFRVSTPYAETRTRPSPWPDARQSRELDKPGN